MIEIKDCSKLFGSFIAVDNISLSIPTGQIIGLLGPNGAGKTTTMRMITGFLNATSGNVFIDGEDITQDPVTIKKKIGYMPESALLYGDMIVYDYLCYIAKMHDVSYEERVPVLCKECGLNEVMHKNISELSRGYRQRVGLAHALMNDPEILILDEPTSGLDPNQVEDVRSLIKEIGKTRTVIVSTHILSEVEMLCSRVIIINKGKVVADSPVDKLKEKYGKSSIVKLTTDAPKVELSSLLNSIEEVESFNFDGEEEGKTFLSITAKGDNEVRPILARAIVNANFNLYYIDIQKNSLEDIFHTLTTETN